MRHMNFILELCTFFGQKAGFALLLKVDKKILKMKKLVCGLLLLSAPIVGCDQPDPFAFCSYFSVTQSLHKRRSDPLSLAVCDQDDDFAVAILNSILQ